eukprot:TRINITY_DN8790_c0_g1_i13.p1 TRINITY_DN8790_c0_g1~~TRINITY_DN8790_c0_g1_i13.p1  ORF type:complete len:190 (-),score=31.39 TRINITY_DN8790_c0_g1_i13:1299-1868(-)
MTRKPPKPKACKTCGNPFTPRAMGQKCCSTPCAIEHVRKIEGAKILSAARKQRKEARAKLMTVSDWAKRAQTAVNAFVRLRDADLPCVSCGRHHQGQYHAGHFRTVKACPELRYEPDNIQKQCAPCNDHLSGNIVPYRAELIRRIGIERVEWIEGPHEPKRYRIEDLKAIEVEFKAKTNELLRQQRMAA